MGLFVFRDRPCRRPMGFGFVREPTAFPRSTGRSQAAGRVFVKLSRARARVPVVSCSPPGGQAGRERLASRFGALEQSVAVLIDDLSTGCERGVSPASSSSRERPQATGAGESFARSYTRPREPVRKIRERPLLESGGGAVLVAMGRSHGVRFVERAGGVLEAMPDESFFRSYVRARRLGKTCSRTP